MATVGQLLDEAERAFCSIPFPDPIHEAAYLLGGRLNLTSSELTLRRRDSVPEEQVVLVRSDVERRLKREPADYILGWKEFLGRRFAVDSRVLLPRPETEALAGAGIELARRRRGVRVLDVGTGSGCIAVSVALEAPGTEVTAVDLSADALAVARSNAERLGARSVAFFQGDLFEGLPPEKRANFDIILSNPPYIPTRVVESLEPELSFEPGLALDGGADGLSVIRRLIGGAPAFMAPNGRLFIEIGFDQGPAVAKILKTAGFTDVSITQDLEKHDRIASGVFIGPA